ncbi:1-acyl-sn-glycerol-3-phosphate acyltransferase [Fodinibius salinus]|uniref:1-acyl-sn-glycerol-3-phosphate acyltransferase n=1 Tax=Fodinibius salinus TaxID=860790 RepID=A0A5D3YML9_9BACT|nr:1-acyl-sn-glycerol-3-phosphate acyltransferase [Fodinibius salinus]TYP95124.1 1-acyl-sn-glycerol-3-phosphate acyltransferase [Fodinibius salinus]
MIPTLRASVRMTLFMMVSLVTVLLVAAGNAVLYFFKDEWRIYWKNSVTSAWAKITAFVLGLQVEVKGQPPSPPFFLVSNHLSYIDIVLLWQNIDATFVAKGEIKSWPFFGWATQTLGVLFINRLLRRDVYRVNEKISEAISSVQGIILFPEGTTSPGAEVLSFNAPLLEYPATKAMPVHYATISYTTNDVEKPASRHICWWGDMEFIPHLWKLLQLKNFRGTITFGEHTVKENSRKELANKLHAAVQRQFIPTAEEDKPITGQE